MPPAPSVEGKSKRCHDLIAAAFAYVMLVCCLQVLAGNVRESGEAQRLVDAPERLV